jgi:hypothetical protein
MTASRRIGLSSIFKAAWRRADSVTGPQGVEISIDFSPLILANHDFNIGSNPLD